jgi:hypothetical protein
MVDKNMNQRELQIWNDAVAACEKAAWKEVEKMEAEAANGMPSPARSVVREVGRLRKSGDDRNQAKGLLIDISMFASGPSED